MDAALNPAYPPAGARPVRRPVLVVDDDDSLRALIGHFLRQEGFTVEEAADGAEAIHMLEQWRAAGAPVGLVLLDLMLPQTSGLDVLQYLAARSADVPVVAMSVNDPLLIAAATAGADGVLIKPFDLEQLLPVVARHCDVAPR